MEAITDWAESQAKPATESLGERRWFYSVVPNDHSRCRTTVIEGDKEQSFITPPLFETYEEPLEWPVHISVSRIVARWTTHRANYFFPRHAFLDPPEPRHRHARAARHHEPAAEACQHERGKQQSTECAATGHGITHRPSQ